jgi:hypothetical protein
MPVAPSLSIFYKEITAIFNAQTISIGFSISQLTPIEN